MHSTERNLQEGLNRFLFEARMRTFMRTHAQYRVYAYFAWQLVGNHLCESLRTLQLPLKSRARRFICS
jgi:hypothetical protein